MVRLRGVVLSEAPLRGAFRSACAAGTGRGRRGRGCRDIDAAPRLEAAGRLPCTGGLRRRLVQGLHAAGKRPARAGRRQRASGPRPGRCFVGADQPRVGCAGMPTRTIASAAGGSPWPPVVEAPSGEWLESLRADRHWARRGSRAARAPEPSGGLEPGCGVDSPAPTPTSPVNRLGGPCAPESAAQRRALASTPRSRTIAQRGSCGQALRKGWVSFPAPGRSELAAPTPRSQPSDPPRRPTPHHGSSSGRLRPARGQIRTRRRRTRASRLGAGSTWCAAAAAGSAPSPDGAGPFSSPAAAARARAASPAAAWRTARRRRRPAGRR